CHIRPFKTVNIILVCVLDLQWCVTTSPGNRHHHLAWTREHLRWMRDQWVSVLFPEGRFMLNRNDGHQQCSRRQGGLYVSATVVARQTFGGVAVWAGVSGQYRTALHFVNGTVTSLYYLNNIINPAIVALHEQHRPISCS
ncbi:hypothetical protein GOODEAATRI_030816, partial [Goodea atripinnis]